MVQNLIYLAPASAIAALIAVVYYWRVVMSHDEGTEEMVEIAQAIRVGARAFMRRQYRTVFFFFLVMFVVLYAFVFLGYLNVFVPWAFVSGAAFSALAGFIGMTMATYANSRTTNAARTSLNKALRVAFSGGAVTGGLIVVGLALFHLSFWYFFLNWHYSALEELARIKIITSTMLNFGMGASAMALFARVGGGGIYTKAADVGADLVGKIEANIPEDDPRNPAVIADNVGDNVGDIAGLGGRICMNPTSGGDCGHLRFGGRCRIGGDGRCRGAAGLIRYWRLRFYLWYAVCPDRGRSDPEAAAFGLKARCVYRCRG